MLLSGGIDSSACAFLLRREYIVYAITFEYSGFLGGEMKAAMSIGKAAGVKEHRLAPLPGVREASDIQGAVFPDLPPNYIPLRNAIFYSYAASYAEEVGADAIAGGHNADDAKTFRDVRSNFFVPLGIALRAGSAVLERKKLRILRPLKNRTKPEVVKLAAGLGVPFELTWSCHRDGTEHCWECGGCKARGRSFERAGVHDPLRPV